MKRDTGNDQSTAMLWASWIAVTAFGWAVGWAVGSGLAGEAFGGPVSAGIGGTLAGLAQGVLLAHAGYTWGRTWALVSSAPVLIAVSAGVAFTVASGGRLYVGLVGIPAIVLMTVAGQWWVLRKRVRVDRAGWWVIGVLAGFIAGGAAVSLLRFGARIPIGASGDAILGGIGGTVLGGTMAAINGAVLMRLLGRLPARGERRRTSTSRSRTRRARTSSWIDGRSASESYLRRSTSTLPAVSRDRHRK